MIDPLFARVIALGLGTLLLAAAWHKVAAHAEFAAALHDYRLLPRTLLRPVALSLPVVEATLAAAWLTGGRGALMISSTAALLSIYAAAIAINLLRGRDRIACGCGLGGRGSDDQRLSWWLVIRNLVLAALAALAAWPTTGRRPGLVDALTLPCTVLAAALLHEGVWQLMRNAPLFGARRAVRG